MPRRDARLNFVRMSDAACRAGCPKCIRCDTHHTANRAGVCTKCLTVAARKKKRRADMPEAEPSLCGRCNEQPMGVDDVGVCAACVVEMADLKASIRSGKLVVAIMR